MIRYNSDSGNLAVTNVRVVMQLKGVAELFSLTEPLPSSLPAWSGRISFLHSVCGVALNNMMSNRVVFKL